MPAASVFALIGLVFIVVLPSCVISDGLPPRAFAVVAA